MANSAQKSDPESDGTVNQSDSDTCLICLEPMNNRSLTDTCMHSFCLQCLNEWSQNHNICPLCRRVYRNILSNYVSQSEFDLIAVPHIGPAPDEPQPQIPDPIRTLVEQLQNYRQYNTLQEQHHLNLYNQLNQLGVNSIEYLQTMQSILNLEDRLEDNRQRIALLRINLRNAIVEHQQQANPPQEVAQQVNGPQEDTDHNESDQSGQDFSDDESGSDGNDNQQNPPQN